MLQTLIHVVCECHLLKDACKHTLRPSIADLSPDIIFGITVGGKALVHFIEEMQTCMRLRRRNPEDHS
jgi:hypothetical protein